MAVAYDPNLYVGPPEGMSFRDAGFDDLQRAEELRWREHFGIIFSYCSQYGSTPPFVNKGWQPLVWEYLEQADAICNRHGVQFVVAQIKQKFAGLRLYSSIVLPEYPTEEQEHAIAQATEELSELEQRVEHSASLTCERCGSTTEVASRGRSWIMRVCNQCHEGTLES